ncbi:uroporphyrinogen-III C-methyltransferase [Pseudomonas sp. F1_0610]|uniref:uroporphyrinogen-III C-methyltransferase n=1 Tax=Pseudomonas sp. F1_0610 TaxID=3114284 RepID=UPI0039C3AAD2
MSQNAKEPNTDTEKEHAQTESPATTDAKVTATQSAAKTSLGKKSKEPKNPSLNNKIAPIALVIGLLGLGFGAYSTVQLHLFKSTLSAQPEQVQSQTEPTFDSAALEQRITAQLEQRIQQISQPPAENTNWQEQITRLAKQQDQLNQRINSALSQSRQDWSLTEAQQLLRMAALRLTILQDTDSALLLLNNVDRILSQQNDDIGLKDARVALSDIITNITQQGRVDRTGIYIRLNSLRLNANKLETFIPSFKGDETPIDPDAEGWDSWTQEMSKYVRIQTGNTEKIKPILSGKSLLEVRLAINLSLEQAQWAAFNGETEVYTAALNQAIDTIQSFFKQSNPEAANLISQLEELKKQPISAKIPDLAPAMDELNAYINKRTPQTKADKEAR